MSWCTASPVPVLILLHILTFVGKAIFLKTESQTLNSMNEYQQDSIKQANSVSQLVTYEDMALSL